MSLSFGLVAVLLAPLVCKIIHEWIFKEDKLRDFPGPKGWPLVGNSLQMDPTNPHKTLFDWSRKYGDMFKIKIFKDDTIILNDYESILQMLNSEECSSRPYIFRILEISLKGLKDITFQKFSPAWNENKKALTRSLNAYGAGLRKIEHITLESIDKLFDDVKRDTNNFRSSIDIKPHIHMCTVGIISTLFYGRKLADNKLMELLEIESRGLKFGSPAGLIAILDHFPWMRYLPIKNIQECIKDAEAFRTWILKRQIERKQDERNFEDCILASLMKHVNKFSNKLLTDEELTGMTHNLITAGFITTTATLYSLLLVLINFPEIQNRMYVEIQQVTKGARPKVSDRSGMTYVKAVMEEIFRYSTILPLGAPHYTEEDAIIQNKCVPKGTTILANFWKLHHDERYFVDPWKFKPERFLDESGQMVSRDEAVSKHSFPFSAGRRICPGEGLARNRIFLIIASLLQKYKFLPEDEQNIPSCDPRHYDSGIVVMPFRYKVKLMER